MSKIINQMEAKKRILEDSTWDRLIVEAELDGDNGFKCSYFGNSELEDKNDVEIKQEILKVLKCINASLTKKVYFRKTKNMENKNQEIPVKAPELCEKLRQKAKIEFWYIKPKSKKVKKYLLQWKIVTDPEMSDDEMCVLLSHIIIPLQK